jgi:ubiquinone/menaquinone biosynthesis C-methylase UbiE
MPIDTDAQVPLAATGERVMTDDRTHTAAEHLHRYAIALQFAQGRIVLDIASGEGYGTNLLASRAAFVHGVDVSSEAAAHAAHKYRRENLRYLQGSATAIPLQDASVDLIVSFETIEHLREHDEMMAEIRRVLRPDGTLIMSSPDKRNYSDLTGHENPFHLRELYSQEFQALIEKYFPYACFLMQRISYGSLVAPELPAPGFVEYRGDFDAVDAHAGLQQAVYNIAIASSQPVANMPTSFWAADAIHEQLLRDYDAMRSRLEMLQQKPRSSKSRFKEALKRFFR